MNVSNKYLLADYMQDRQKAATGTTPAGTSTVKTPVGIAASPAVKAPTVTAPKTITQPTATAPSSAGAASAGSTATGAVVNADEVVTKSQFTTADVDAKMQSVLQEIMDFGSRKFQYNAKESPLYTILEQQAAKEARLASGRAYSVATANTGGFGSSYAGLAAEEASRQVMAGLDDQQLALYQAAKEEFDSQYQSKLQQYDALRTIYGDLEAKEAKEAEQATTESGMTAGASEAAQYLLNTYGMAYSENAMRQDLLGKGYSEADVNAALESQRKMVGGAVTDYKAGSISSAIGQAGTLDEAYRQGQLTVEEYDAAKADNSKVIMDSVYKGLDRLEDADYAALGYSAEEWQTMEDADKKKALFEAVGQYAKNGYVTQDDYYDMLYSDIAEEFDSDDFKNSKDPVRYMTKIAETIEGYYDRGYLKKDDYVDIMYNVIGSEMLQNEAVKVLIKRVKDLRSRDGKDITWQKLERNFGVDAFPGDMSKAEKSMLMEMANHFARVEEDQA